tara:strand:- start:256 stop:717 length:462 start_codon:yes stop_codon:yes gene_type:complete
MTNDSDIQNLISSESKMFSFSIEDIQTIFKECDKELDILYSIFLNNEFIYIGRCGVTNFQHFRLNSHRSGRRSGDQFCIYIQDFYVLPSLIKTLKENNEDYVFEKGRLDREVGNFISENLRLKYLSVQKDDVVDLENRIREGKYGRTPKLSPK